MKADIALSEVLSVLGHDLANELAAASLTTAMLRKLVTAGESIDEGALADLEEVLATMRRKIDCALGLRRLLDRSMRVSPSRFDGADVVAQIAAAIGIAPESAGGGRVDADRGLVATALGGIAARAAFVSRAVTDIRVRVTTAGDDVRFSIEDSGPVEEVERIESLLREAGCAIDHGSASIELAFARMVAELHGGRMAVGPADAGGALISITLPAADAAERTDT